MKKNQNVSLSSNNLELGLDAAGQTPFLGGRTPNKSEPDNLHQSSSVSIRRKSFALTKNQRIEVAIEQQEQAPPLVVNRLKKDHEIVRQNLSWSPTTTRDLDTRPRLYSSQCHHQRALSRSTKVKQWIEGRYNR